MKKDRAVLFDLGNVLVRIHPEAFAATLGISESERGQYRPRVIAATQRYERGKFTTDEYFADLSGIFEERFGRPKLEEAMRNVIGQPIPGMAELLEKAVKTTTVALVSNTNDFHFSYCQKNFPFISHIPSFFLSWKMGVLKPDTEYYSQVIRGINLPPDRVIFIDDMPENIEGAKKAGMTGIIFTGVEELTEYLKKLGVS